MASPSELSLDCKPYNTYSMLLKSFGDQTEGQTQKLEDFLARLEEERLKIDAFKRELPLCMQLLTNAVETSRQQLQAYRANQGATRPVLEEFIPLKNSNSELGSEKASNCISDKANWMTSAQLWSQTSDDQTKQQQSTTTTSPQEAANNNNIGFSVISPKLGLDSKQRNGGAFLPFSKDRNSGSGPILRALPDLALASNGPEMEDKKRCEDENGLSCQGRENSCKVGNGASHEQGKATINPSTDSQATTTTSNNGNNNSQTHRKARRCWSPDLHRRFVSALQMLGGSQVATPKQIRELMKVDGLTNDEVKSHLQKYRLHTRRPISPSPQAPGGPPPQLVVLGGIWVPPEYAAAAAAHGGAAATTATLYGTASHAPPRYCAPQDHFYTTTAPPPLPHHHHHQLLHHQLHVYKSSPQAHSSPESDVRGTGDRSESIEDGKSESSSWKGDSVENNGGERKGLAALRDQDGEESNGSEITLKF